MVFSRVAGSHSCVRQSAQLRKVRFIAEKLRSTEARDLETSVRQLELNLHEGRWGTLINTCKQLLSVRMVFAYWSPDQPAPGPQASQEDRDSYEQVCAMTTAVRDNSW